MKIDLLPVRESDLPLFFNHQRDSDAVAMVGFTSRSRPDFDAHWARILATPGTVVRTIDVDGRVAGYVTAFHHAGRREVAYWLGREHWNKGIGGRALALLLEIVPDRPLFATVATTNTASLAILHRCGFAIIGNTNEEHLLRLD